MPEDAGRLGFTSRALLIPIDHIVIKDGRHLVEARMNRNGKHIDVFGWNKLPPGQSLLDESHFSGRLRTRRPVSIEEQVRRQVGGEWGRVITFTGYDKSLTALMSEEATTTSCSFDG